MSIAKVFIAAAKDDRRELRRLVDLGIDPNTIDKADGRSLLCVATNCGSIAALQELLRRGADPNLRFGYRSRVSGQVESNVTALMYATSADAAKTLIDAGADVNAADDL